MMTLEQFRLHRPVLARELLRFIGNTGHTGGGAQVLSVRSASEVEFREGVRFVARVAWPGPTPPGRPESDVTCAVREPDEPFIWYD